MEKYFDAITKNKLFADILPINFKDMLGCIGGSLKIFAKKETIFFSGDTVNFVGLVLSGAVKITKTDEDGRESIVAEAQVGDSFGEAFACAEITASPVSVVASQKSEILFINYHKIITRCDNSCAFHTKLIENLLKVIALKNFDLNQKIDIISQKTLRGKILCYLNYERKGRRHFTLPFSREDMANYLCADRSAVSAELSRMQRDGLIKYKNRQFEILNGEK